MSVVNQYKMYGVTSTTAEGPIKFFGTTTISGVATQNPLVSETYIIKSFHVTNKSGSNTPTITIKNNTFNIVNTQALVANSSTEILTLPLVVEGAKLLKVTMSSGDSVTIGITYLNIKKEVTV